MNIVCRLPLRWLVLVVGLVALVQFVLAGASYLSMRDSAAGFRLPLPERIARIVEAVEALPAAQRATVLPALQDRELSVWVASALPEDEAGVAPMASVASVVDRYIQHLGAREVQAWLALPEGHGAAFVRFENMRLWSRYPLRLGVALNSGDVLIFETRENKSEAYFGFPPGLAAGFWGAIVTLIALLMVFRSLAPLETMARSVTEFARDPRPNPVPVSGAPETRRIGAAINAMQERVVELLREREATFAAVSHDLRTHLTKLRLRLHAMPDSIERDKAEADLESMGDIIEGHLAFARVQGAELRFEPVALSELLYSVCAHSSPQIPADIPSNLPEVFADPRLVCRAVENLIDNAQKHAATPKLRAAWEGDTVEIEVSDDGPGVPEAEIDRLLRPFERGFAGGPQQSVSHGSGLGLAIVKRIAERHGGTFAIFNRPGGGLTACIRLPVVAPSKTRAA